MNSNRIQPLSLPLSVDMQATMDKIFPPQLPSPNLYRMVARNENLFKDLVESRFIGPTGLFDRKRLSPSLREKIILRTCIATNNQYEFALHVETISMKMGLTAAQIEDIENTSLNPGHWTAADLILFELIDGLVKKTEVAQDVFERASQHFEEAELIEIVFITGLYTTVAMLVALGKPDFDHYGKITKG